MIKREEINALPLQLSQWQPLNGTVGLRKSTEVGEEWESNGQPVVDWDELGDAKAEDMSSDKYVILTNSRSTDASKHHNKAKNISNKSDFVLFLVLTQ